MAKSGKVIQLFQKPENFIMSRARQLALGKCYISSNWERSQLANVIVSRCHINGNFTLGIYLIDLGCLGIKDVVFKFNISTEELESLIEIIAGEEIDYIKAHNIIYGSMSFAESCGFKPHKDWSVGQYMLEEDDDRVQLMDIQFGENGVPAYRVAKYDDPATTNIILKTLDKHLGSGNYLICFADEGADYSAGQKLVGADDESDESTLAQIYYQLTSNYLFRNQHLAKYNNVEEDLISEILEEQVSGNFYTIDDALDKKILQFTQTHESLLQNKSLKSIEKLKGIIAKESRNPYLYLELFSQYKELGLDDEASQVAQQGMLLFPDFLYLRFFVAHAAMIDQKLKKGFELLNTQYDLHQAFPYRNTFAEGEFMYFYAAICQYFLAKNNIANAISCGNILIDDIDTYSCNENAVVNICTAIKYQLNL